MCVVGNELAHVSLPGANGVISGQRYCNCGHKILKRDQINPAVWGNKKVGAQISTSRHLDINSVRFTSFQLEFCTWYESPRAASNSSMRVSSHPGGTGGTKGTAGTAMCRPGPLISVNLGTAELPRYDFHLKVGSRKIEIPKPELSSKEETWHQTPWAPEAFSFTTYPRVTGLPSCGGITCPSNESLQLRVCGMPRLKRFREIRGF